VFAIGIASRSKAPVREAVSHKDDHKQTFICGFLMLMNYGVMYERHRGQAPQSNTCSGTAGIGDAYSEDVIQDLRWQSHYLAAATPRVVEMKKERFCARIWRTPRFWRVWRFRGAREQ